MHINHASSAYTMAIAAILVMRGYVSPRSLRVPRIHEEVEDDDNENHQIAPESSNDAIVEKEGVYGPIDGVEQQQQP